MTGLEPAILFFLAGLGAMLAARLPLERFHGAALPALAWTAGLTAMTWIVMLPGLATGRFFLPVAWALGVAGLGIAVWRYSDLKDRRRRLDWSLVPEGRLPRLILVLLAGATLYNVVMVCWLAMSYPIIGYDAIGNYAMKAQLWFHTRELFPPLLMDPEFVMYHRRYPPAIPVAEMVWAFVLGDWNDVKIKLFFLISWLCLGGLVYGALRRRNGLMPAWLGAAAWIAAPYHLRELHGGATDAYPEITHTLALLAGLMLARELRGERHWGRAALMAFVVAGSVLIKQEGLFFIGLVFVYLLAARAPLKNAGLVALFAVVNVAIWKLAGRGVPDFLDESYAKMNVSLGEIGQRLKFLAGFGWDMLRHEDQWGLVVWALPVAWVYKLWRVPRGRWLSLELAAGLGLMVCYTMVLLNTPLDFEVHLDTTLHRLFLHALPFLMIATFDGLDEGRPFHESRLARWLSRARASTPAEAAAEHGE